MEFFAYFSEMKYWVHKMLKINMKLTLVIKDM